MRKGKVLLTPLLVMAAIVLVLGSRWSPLTGAAGRFVWETLMGAAFGLVLGLMPVLSGEGARGGFATYRWLAFALVMLVMLYQYMAAFWGVRISGLAWLHVAESELARFAEGCLAGYCLFGALRARR